MTLKERLLVATRKAAEAYNKGAAPSSAVVKAAKDYGFNQDQTERLVEMFNTALTLHKFHKNAADRTGEFELADKADVLRGLYAEKPKEKKAMAHDYSFYDSPARNMVKAAHVPPAPMEKAASGSETKEPDVASLLRYANLAKEGAETAAEAEGAVMAHVQTEVYKLAEAIHRSYEPEEKYRKVKYAASDSPKLIELLESVLPERIKSAKDFLPDDLVDLSDIAPEKGMVDHIKKMLKDVDDFQITRITFSKKAEEAWNRVMAPYQHKVDVDIFGSVAQKAAQAKEMLSKMFPIFPKAEDVPSLPELVGAQSAEELQNEAATLDNDQRQALLQDLMVTDPIISEADPQNVMDMYSTIVNIAPKVSMHKEIVRSMLRQAVNSVALSPYDAQAYVNLNSALK